MSTETLTKPQTKTSFLPPWKVILHDDDVNVATTIVSRIIEFVRLEHSIAVEKTSEAHNEGQSVLTITHREHAELIEDQFSSCVPPITVTVEPAN